MHTGGQPVKDADKGPLKCQDDDPCTTGETCEGKTCKPSAVTCLCQTNADCVLKDDGDLCNRIYYCDKSLKVPACAFNPASVVFCPQER